MAQAHMIILNTIAAAFNLLKDDIHTVLLTQLSDAAQLEQRIQACTGVMLQINQVITSSFIQIFKTLLMTGQACQYYSS